MEWLKDSLRSKDSEDPEPSNLTSSTRGLTGQGSHFNKQDDIGGDTARSDNEESSHLIPDLEQPNELSSEGTGIAAIGETTTYSSRVLPPGDAVPSVIDPTSSDPTTFKMPEHTYQPNIGVPSGAAETAASRAFHKDIEQEISHIPGAFPKDDPSTPATESTSAIEKIPVAGGFPRDKPSTPAAESTLAALTGTAGAAAAGIGATEYGDRRTAPTHESTVPAPPSLTTTSSPANRNAEYGQAEKTKIPDRSVAAEPPTTTTSTANVSGEQEQASTLDRILGAVGLGAAAGSVSAALSGANDDDKSQSKAERPEQPTTTTGVDSYTAPTRSEPSPSHHRKESIPTTAYPGGQSSPSPINPPVGGTEQPITTTGVDSYTAPPRSGPSPPRYRKESIPTTAYPQGELSPSPINPPVGGTAVDAEEPEHKNHTSRDAGLAAAGVGIGAGGAAFGAHEYNESRPQAEEPLRQPTSPTSFYSQTTSDVPSAPSQQASTSARGFDEGRTNTTSFNESAPDYSQTPPATEPQQQSTGYGRVGTAAGVGAGAGAAAYGAYEYGESRTQPEDAPGYASAPTTNEPTTTSSLPYESSQQTSSLSRGYDEPTTTSSSTFAPTQQTGDLALGYNEKPMAPYSSIEPSTYQSETTTATEPENGSRGYGKAAAATGVGAGAGAAGYYALEHRNEPETGDLAGSRAHPDTEALAQPDTYQRAEKVPDRTHNEPVASTSSTASYQPPTTAPAPQEPVASTRDTNPKHAAAAGHTPETSSRADPSVQPEQDERHTGRDTAIAGAAEAGAGAYGVHEYNKHEDEEEIAKAEAQRQHDIAEQEAARQRQFEKDQKAAEKRAAKEEKAEKQHQKAIEKEEKKHHKEMEKDAEYHQKEFEREQKEREQIEATEAERRRRETEAAGAAVVGTGAAAGTAAYAGHDEEATPKSSQDTDRNRLHKDPPQEKKPGILKRIFGRHKNKDDGHEGEYSSDEEDETHHGTHAAEAGAVGGAGAVAAHESHDTTGVGSNYEPGHETGFQKPSYNPLHHDDFGPSTTETPIAENLAHDRQA